MMNFMKLFAFYMLAVVALTSADQMEERRSNLRADPVDAGETSEAERPGSRGLRLWDLLYSRPSTSTFSFLGWNPYAAPCHPIHCPAFSYPNAHDGCTDHIGECMCFHGYYMEHGRCVRRH